MKAYPFEEKRLAKWSPPFIVQPKFDGVRCRAIPLSLTGPKDNEYMLLSSEENVIYSVPHINTMLSELNINEELDGELYCHGLPFDGPGGILSITSRTVNLHPDHEKIQFHIFDVVNEQPQMKRQLMIEDLRGINPWLVVAPFWICANFGEVMEVYNALTGEGYEGIIVRHCNAPYVKKRSTFVMKFKPKKEDTYEIVGFVEEESIAGVPKRSLGSLICNSGDGNTFSVGTGFTASERDSFWHNREELIGKIARVKYQHLTSGKKVPRFNVFVEVVENGN